MPLISTPKPYKYEVAFSFLQEDEALAYALNDLIQDRLATFIYSQKQKEGVGRDGMTWFRNVFAQEARIVVVLYREAWGSTDWTRVEEEAIKERVLDESSDFIVFINLERGKPNWLSRTHIRLNLDRYGKKEAAAIIEHRVAEYGGLVREETITDQAARHQRDLDYRLELANYLKTPTAVEAAREEWNAMFSALQQTVNGLQNNRLGYLFGTSTHKATRFICFGQDVGLGFILKMPYTDTLESSALLITLGHADCFDDSPLRTHVVYETWRYRFTRTQSHAFGWVNESDDNDFKTTEGLIQQCFKPFLDLVHTALLTNHQHRFAVK